MAVRPGLATVRLGLGDDEECEGLPGSRRVAKGRRCDLEWVSVWVGVIGDLEFLIAMVS